MGVKKHGISDNVSGLDKNTKARITNATRRQAQAQKASRQNNGNATNQEGNRGTR